MKIYLSLLILAIASSSAFATAFTVTDPFNTTCSSPNPALNCDVVGANSAFDIQRGEFDFGATSATIRLYFNYGPNNTSLAPFNLTPSVVLSLGDLFISGSGFSYGLSLQSRNTAVSGAINGGTLYQINNSNGTLTARQALNDPNITYRPDEIVWLNNSVAGALTPLINGAVSVATGGNGVTEAEFVATIVLNYAANSMVARNLNGIVNVSFASATCGNDMLTGSNIPEPGTISLIGAALILAGTMRLRKRS